MHRRHAIRASAAFAAGLYGVPGARAAFEPPPALPDEALFRRDPAAWWSRVRDEQFYLPGWRAFLNNGSLGVAPRPVLHAVGGYMARSAELNVAPYPRWGYETMDEHRAELAAFFGCHRDELAFTHNATEAMSMIANGVDLNEGDEVVITDQEHPSGRSPWYLKQARSRIAVREVPIPVTPRGPEQIADILISAIGPKTRVVSFSGITTTTGLILPVRQICDAARAKGVITVVDGAHMHGQIPFRIEDLGCDFMAASPHKWVFAPAGCGLLYARREMQERLWPTIVTGSWDKKELMAARYMMVGTNNRAIFEGLMAGLGFLKALGPERVYGRIRQLGRMALDRALASPHLAAVTPNDGRLFAGLVTVRFREPAKLEKLHALQTKKRIWCFQAERVRLSTHIHTRPADVELYFDTIREALGG